MIDVTLYVQIENLKKVYKTKDRYVTALENVAFNVEKGQFVVLVGQSGCGKSTLLNIVAGLLEATEGNVIVAAERVTKPILNVGMVFQSPVLLPWRNVVKNIMLGAELRKLDTDKCLKRTEELIKLVRLDEFKACYPKELSGGMQQRVSIARALLLDPELLLMDEPFGALDAFTREIMNLELLRIWGGEGKVVGEGGRARTEHKTVIFVTHNVEEAVFLADKIIVMTPRPGRVREIIDVTLPRPRNIDTMGSPEFAKLGMEIRELLMKN